MKTGAMDALVQIIEPKIIKNFDGKWYYSFDIGVEVDEAKYVDWFGISFKYNSNVFGSNIKLNEKVHVKKIGIMDIPAESDPFPFLTVVDHAVDTFGCGYNTNVFTSNMLRPQLKTGEMNKMYNILIALDTPYTYCDLPINLEITQSAFIYTETATSSSVFSPTISFGTEIARKARRPVIESITSDIRAGKEEFLVVEGYPSHPAKTMTGRPT